MQGCRCFIGFLQEGNAASEADGGDGCGHGGVNGYFRPAHANRHRHDTQKGQGKGPGADGLGRGRFVGVGGMDGARAMDGGIKAEERPGEEDGGLAGVGHAMEVSGLGGLLSTPRSPPPPESKRTEGFVRNVSVCSDRGGRVTSYFTNASCRK